MPLAEPPFYLPADGFGPPEVGLDRLVAAEQHRVCAADEFPIGPEPQVLLDCLQQLIESQRRGHGGSEVG
jgi:hypothetical protein